MTFNINDMYVHTRLNFLLNVIVELLSIKNNYTGNYVKNLKTVNCNVDTT